MTITHTRHTRGHPAKQTAVFDHPDHTLVKVRGDLDIATAPMLREQLVAALRPRTGPLILDLSGVSFCDAAGLAVLIGTRRRAAALGIVMLLAAPGPRLCTLLEFTGLGRSLPVHPTVARARVWSRTHTGATRHQPQPASAIPAR